jgi:hypothetical protein
MSHLIMRRLREVQAYYSTTCKSVARATSYAEDISCASLAFFIVDLHLRAFSRFFEGSHRETAVFDRFATHHDVTSCPEMLDAA